MPNLHPFEIWKNQEVTDLLLNFYEANFRKAGIPEEIAEELIFSIWQEKGKTENKILAKKVADIMLKAKEHIQFHIAETELIKLWNLENVKTFLDVGANRLTAINHYASKYPSIEKFIAIDVIPQKEKFRVPEKSSYFQINTEDKSFPVVNNSIDCINIQFVLHHFENFDSIKNTLEKCQKAIRPGGLLMFWEETFRENLNIDSLVKENNRLGIFTDKELMEKFYKLDKEKRFEFIIANDWLINIGNAHMQWTGQYRTWEEWIELFAEYGFILNKEFNLGLRANGRLKQGVHVLGKFRKK